MANYVESAVLRLQDQTSGPAAKINAALRQLWQSANRLRGVKIDLFAGGASGKAQAQIAQLRALDREIGKLANGRRQLPQLVVRVDSSQVARAITRIGELHRAAGQTLPGQRLGASGFGGGGGRGPGPGQPNNLFHWRRDDSNWDAAGRIMARSFVAVAGASLATQVGRAIANGGRAVSRADTVGAKADVSGVDTKALTAAAQRSASRFRGTSIADISDAAIEQAAGLTVDFKAGRISLDQFNSKLQELTDRVARNAQIIGQSTGNFKAGGEEARQLEKSLEVFRGAAPNLKGDLAEGLLKAYISAGGDTRQEEIKRLGQQLGSLVAAGFSDDAIKLAVLARDEGGKASTAEIRMASEAMVAAADAIKKEAVVKQQALGLRDAQGRSTATEAERQNPFLYVERLANIMRRKGLDPNDQTAVNKFLAEQSGFTKSQQRFFAKNIPSIEKNMRDLGRTNQIDLNKTIANPTIATAIADLSAKAQDAAVALGDATGATNAIKSRLIGLADTLGNISRGNFTGLDGAKIAEALAVAVAGAFAAKKTLDFFSPMAGAARNLNASAVNLNNAARALSAASGRPMPGGPGAPAPGSRVGGAVGGAVGGIAGGFGGQAIGEAIGAYLGGDAGKQVGATIGGAAGVALGIKAGEVAGAALVTALGLPAVGAALATAIAAAMVLKPTTTNPDEDRKIEQQRKDGTFGQGKMTGSSPTEVARAVGEERLRVEREITAAVVERADSLNRIAKLEEELRKSRENSKRFNLPEDPNNPRRENEIETERSRVASLDEQLAKFEAAQRALVAEQAQAMETAATNSKFAISTSFAEGGTTAASSFNTGVNPAGMGSTIGSRAAAEFMAGVNGLKIGVELKTGPNTGRMDGSR